MDSKEAKESKGVKDTKETKTLKSSKKGIWYFIVIVILIIVILGLFVFYQTQTSGLQNQVNQLEKNNSDLNNQITGFSVKIDTLNKLKNFSENVKSGQVPFWDENSNDIITGIVPLNFYSARVLSQNIISKNSERFVNNFSFSKITQNKTIWTSNFVCSGINDSSCGATVVINEGQRSYSVSS